MNREERVRRAAETLEIVERGWYENGKGQRVILAAAVEACTAGS